MFWVLLALFAVRVRSEETPSSLWSRVFPMDDGTGMQKEPSPGLLLQDVKSSIKVSTLLYDTAQLPCVFPFVEGPERLTVVWKKKEKDKAEPIIIHSLMNGQEHHLVQDSRYEGRTELSTDFSHGDLGLKLRGVTFADEGTYYCLAANDRNRGARKVELSISGPLTKPTIRDTNTEDQITYTCESPDANLNYKWLDENNITLSTNQTYTAPRPSKITNFTCVVDNKLSQASSSVTFSPSSGFTVNLSACEISWIVFGAIGLIVLIAGLVYYKLTGNR